ncbi:Zn(II)2Cys6 transcription factor [Aspergillus vadensis CBS 113365]|uniref:Zn(2)-C6 fungal-type domain-containing protein n=1 Tax=Aspergillus vadensis (strain CBS 113365 / IMI 142717 / IBT 24658) TaxID=1448311 RepID=A0A319C525_ASPVC|nr:hypothetical protein BO88DRAFT_337078 [Aspergillus vadensis CBS 113365]PYH70538.1 hypothetical protein BO88DRAFT_337078 [Aspergillus vadensis CBS 113365]
MPGVPSNKACERCKKRHLKCDETRPSCQRCTNAGVECPGYVQTRKFIDQGASVRRRYAPYQQENSRRDDSHSPNKVTRESPSNIGGAAIRSNAVNDPIHTRVAATAVSDQPADASQVFFGSPIAESRRQNQLQAESQHSPNASAGAAAAREQPLPDIHSRAAQVSHIHSNPFDDRLHPHGDAPMNYHEEHATADDQLPSHDSQSVQSDKEDFHEVVSELMTDSEHEISFLIRHYSQHIAPWLDLSDSRRFFTTYVPIRAIDYPYVRYSIGALAATHLGQMKGATCPENVGMFTSPAAMETYPNAPEVDWYLKAANYYYMSIARMNSSMPESFATLSSSAVLEGPVEIVKTWLHRHAETTPPSARDDTFWRKAEALLATATMLTMYKIISKPGEEWNLHLTGVNSLFESLLHLNSNSSDPIKFTHGITASFWNFARQDYLASYFNRLPTYLDPTNLPLWRAAGLTFTETGEIDPSSSTSFPTSEDFASNSLTYLLSKLTNFLAHLRTSQLDQLITHPSPPTRTTPTTPPISTSTSTSTTWLNLSVSFQSWVDRMPETFRPCLRLHTPRPEVYYSLPSCASTMQQYHFGRLALCLNRPADVITSPTTAFDRLQGYREVTKEVDYRCKEIVGIAAARPQSCARIYMPALLFAAGQCLEKQEERQVVEELLCGIGADLGWETDSEIQRLKGLWEER